MGAALSTYAIEFYTTLFKKLYVKVVSLISGSYKFFSNIPSTSTPSLPHYPLTF